MKICLRTLSSVLMLVITLALSAQAQPLRFSEWSAPVNLGPAVNTSATDG
jgi:hypothetical protein